MVLSGFGLGRMKYVIIIASILFITFNGGMSSGEQKSDFTLTFNCGNDFHKLCLVGLIAPGKSVTLLSNKRSNICRARTTDSFMYYFEPGENGIPATNLDMDRCQDPEQYSLAYLGTGQVKYQLLELSLFEEKSKVLDFDRLVRKKKLLEYEASIETSPKVFKFPVSRKSILIGQYEAVGQAGYGPLFISAQGDVEKIHFLASVYSVFRLNGRLYMMFYWRGTQEDSGDQGSALVELTESGFKLIFEDTSWSI
jgi:hypothetical protein